ncbi:MAG: hypothetical protein PHV02_18800 [Rhodocyclaceae bacterium]|nr:hypothetical protein [Rhodocyclaceae bacterium]
MGSGRHRQGAKGTTKDYRTLDVRLLQRKGALAPGTTSTLRWSINGNTLEFIQIRAEDDRVILSQDRRREIGEGPGVEYSVFLDWSVCHLGGQRAWFRCPAKGCGRRVALLYSGTIYACRHCYKLAYASQREKGYVRALGKVERLRDKLGWGPGIVNIDHRKPKGMHRRTYARLAAEHNGLVRKYVIGMSQRFEAMERFME